MHLCLPKNQKFPFLTMACYTALFVSFLAFAFTSYNEASNFNEVDQFSSGVNGTEDCVEIFSTFSSIDFVATSYRMTFSIRPLPACMDLICKGNSGTVNWDLKLETY